MKMFRLSFVTGLMLTLGARWLAASTPAEMSYAAAVAGHGLYVDEKTSPETSFDDEWNRMLRISRADPSIFSDPNAALTWSNAQRDASRALAILARIAQIDNRKPSDFDVVISGLAAATEDTKNRDRQEWGKDIWVRLLMEAQKSSLEGDFRNAEKSLDGDLAELAGSVRSPYLGSGISIEHLPSWQGAYDSDLLVLTNNSGRNLSRLAIFVTFEGGDGSRVTHLHHANLWASGQKCYFRYPFYSSNYASGQTVNYPRRVDVYAYSTDGSFRGSKQWSDADYTNTIEGYFPDIKVSAMFLGQYVETGTNRLYYPGAKFSFKGLNRLPVKSITIRFTGRGETAEARWDWNKYLAATEDVSLRSGLLARFSSNNPPERKQIILEFTDASAPAVITW